MTRRLQEWEAWRWIGEQFSRSALVEVNRTGICYAIDELHRARRISAAMYDQMHTRLSLFSPSADDGDHEIHPHWWPVRDRVACYEVREYQSDDQTPRVTVCCFLAAMAAPTRRKAVPRGR